MKKQKNAMNKTVFRRFLFSSIIIVLLCLLIIMGILFYPVTGFIEKAKKDTLQQSAEDVSSYITRINEESNPVPDELMRQYLETLSDSLDADILIADKTGQIVFVNSSDYNHKEGSYIPHLVITNMDEDGFFIHDTLGGFYEQSYYIAATHIHSSDGNVIGYCMIAQHTIWSSDVVPSIFVVFTIVVLLAALLIFVLTSVYAFNTTRPLKQMSAAANKFAVGDFESRVEVKRQDEIGELAQAFNEMADSLSTMEGVRRNFIANVSHELKTPMTTISGYIDGILDGTIPQTEQAYYLEIVSQETKRLSRLVTSMISLSKIDSGEIAVNKSSFDILDVIFNVLQSFESRLGEKKLRVEGLDIEENIIFYGDRDLIHQTLYNLVENAVKFTNEGGYIRFSFKNENGSGFVSVENSGNGILPEDIRYIFDKFYKADKSRSSDKRSMGLGLYIAQTIVKLHGGQISVESTPGESCKFTFSIPNQKTSWKSKFSADA